MARYVGPHFDGDTYEPWNDYIRLGTLLDRVTRLMSDGRWRTLPEIQRRVGGTEASVSARLRDLRKEKFGSHTIERRRIGDSRRGIYEYQLTLQGAGMLF